MHRFFFLVLNIVFIFSLQAQKNTISGYVEDALTEERLIAASVFDVEELKYGTLTNEYGYFSLTLPKKKVHLRISYVGYFPIDTIIEIKGQEIVFRLHPSTILEEVVITGYKQDLKSSQIARISVPIKMIQNLPVIFGEADLMKILQLLPGVQSGKEGTGGIYVRGGGPDQNLILLDGVPVYNLSHMAGFFSVFTPEAIKDVSLYKGGFPARFGGRLSSVIDVRMKDGNMKKLIGSVSIGLISSKFTIEGPIKNNKTSFIVSARRTYYDLLAKPFVSIFSKYEYTDDNSYRVSSKVNGGYYFYDFYAKVNHKFSRKDRVYLSFYSGLDKAYIKNEYEYEYFGTEMENYFYNTKTGGDLYWGNNILAIRWNHAFGNKIFSNLTLTYSRFLFSTNSEIDGYYRQDTIIENLESKLSYELGIQDFALNYDFDYSPNPNHFVRFGLNSIYHHFQPGNISYKLVNNYVSLDTNFGSTDLYAPEFSAYVEDDFKIGEILRFNMGFRLSSFFVRKKVYLSPEPRISARILIGNNISLKLSYTKMMQYLHFLTNNTLGLPLDVWVPATDRIIPENSWQTTAEINFLMSNGINIQIDGFYKEMNNLVELKEGESVFSSTLGSETTWEDNVTQGKGWSYGLEVLIKKDFGRLTGWIGYTLSWSMRKFQEINFGKEFPYKYDSRHNISVVGTYKLKKNITLGFVWVYKSGLPTTIAQDEILDPIYPVSNNIFWGDSSIFYNPINYYGGRNSFRLPAYHRLDLSLNFNKQKKKGVRQWTIGVYNAYNHINPFFTFLNEQVDPETLETKTTIRVISIFPIMPFVSYKFTWK